MSSQNSNNLDHISPRRPLSQVERVALLRDLTPSDLDWMLQHESLTIRDFLNRKLTREQVINNLCYNFQINLPQSPRSCVPCGTSAPRCDMVKCRQCRGWYHSHHFLMCSFFDSRRRFWKCLSCRVQYPGGPTLETATIAEIEEDTHFEDSDNEISDRDNRF